MIATREILQTAVSPALVGDEGSPLPSFVVTGHGRSGTLWLANLLDLTPDSIAVIHEPLSHYDRPRYAQVWAGELDEHKFIRDRIPHIYEVKASPRGGLGLGYAEVNSFLRYSVQGIRDVIGCPVAGIVRDGKRVVNSLIVHGCFQARGNPEHYIQPPEELRGSVFMQCCWYWADTYRRLLALEEWLPIFRLEDLNDNYAAFETLCYEVGISPPSEAIWERHIGVRKNISLPDEPVEWSDEWEAEFARLAGDIQDYFYGEPKPICGIDIWGAL